MCLAVPVKIIRIDGTRGIGEIGGVDREIDLTFLEDPRVGEYVLLHAGFAIQKIDEKEACETLEAFKEFKKYI
ncbi:MAG: HypC/HybG/HupF family hydrogenase formation chaperone [Elusimicrobiota bacterium]